LFVTLPFFHFAKSQDYFYENGSNSRPGGLNFTSSTRSIIDLSGQWQYSIDEGKTWRDVLVPSASNFVSRIIFTRKFEATPQMVGWNSFKLVAFGINYEAEVYINETYVGKHEGGYTSFSMLVPDNVIQVGSENVIRIVVDNHWDARSTLPLRQQIWGWKNYGGIFRDIYLLSTSPLWIDDLMVSTGAVEAKTVQLLVKSTVSARDLSSFDTTALKSSSPQFFFNVEVYDDATGALAGKSLPQAIEPGSNKDVPVSLSVPLTAAKLWSPESPSLYDVRATITAASGKSTPLKTKVSPNAGLVLIDELKTETGIRTVSVSKSSILLKGIPVTLHGVAWIEDSQEHGSALTYEEMEKDIALIKNLGANAVRFAFHPPHPYLLHLCDQYGLLAFEEIPLYETPAAIMSAENYLALAENNLREMIRRDRNHPSVVAWGIGAGFESVDPRAGAVIQGLNNVAKGSDYRLTYYISKSLDDKKNSRLVDIAGVEFPDADVKTFTNDLNLWKREHPDSPVFVGKYGTAVEPQDRNGYSDPMSQQAQARYLMQRFDAIKAAGIAGGFVWTFSDWRGERPIMTVQLPNPFLYTQGIVELNREKKIAYDVVRSLYLGEKVTALPIGSYAPSSPVSYVLLGLMLLLIFAWLLNSNRRFRESVNRALLRPYNFFADIRDQRILSNLHTTILALIVAFTLSIVLSSMFFHYRNNEIADYALTNIVFSDRLKASLIMLVWSPLKCIVVGAMGTIAVMCVVTLLIQLFGMFVRTRVHFFHSYSVAVWSTLPMVIFIPLGMILYRVMQTDMYVVPVLVLFAVIVLWIFFRLLKGVSIIYDILPLKMYAVGLFVLVAIVAGGYTYLDFSRSTTAYVHYVFSTIIPASH
ncbi:MAG: YIP1 family protein, partial [Bacteroidota bacterium]|nr:YIP1 family protein [Bacteroidota bacterium]